MSTTNPAIVALNTHFGIDADLSPRVITGATALIATAIGTTKVASTLPTAVATATPATSASTLPTAVATATPATSASTLPTAVATATSVTLASTLPTAVDTTSSSSSSSSIPAVDTTSSSSSSSSIPAVATATQPTSLSSSSSSIPAVATATQPTSSSSSSSSIPAVATATQPTSSLSSSSSSSSSSALIPAVAVATTSTTSTFFGDDPGMPSNPAYPADPGLLDDIYEDIGLSPHANLFVRGKARVSFQDQVAKFKQFVEGGMVSTKSSSSGKMASSRGLLLSTLTAFFADPSKWGSLVGPTGMKKFEYIDGYATIGATHAHSAQTAALVVVCVSVLIRFSDLPATDVVQEATAMIHSFVANSNWMGCPAVIYATLALMQMDPLFETPVLPDSMAKNVAPFLKSLQDSNLPEVCPEGSLAPTINWLKGHFGERTFNLISTTTRTTVQEDTAHAIVEMLDTKNPNIQQMAMDIWRSASGGAAIKPATTLNQDIIPPGVFAVLDWMRTLPAHCKPTPKTHTMKPGLVVPKLGVPSGKRRGRGRKPKEATTSTASKPKTKGRIPGKEPRQVSAKMAFLLARQKETNENDDDESSSSSCSSEDDSDSKEEDKKTSKKRVTRKTKTARTSTSTAPAPNQKKMKKKPCSTHEEDKACPSTSATPRRTFPGKTPALQPTMEAFLSAKKQIVEFVRRNDTISSMHARDAAETYLKYHRHGDAYTSVAAIRQLCRFLAETINQRAQTKKPCAYFELTFLKPVLTNPEIRFVESKMVKGLDKIFKA